MRGGRCLIGWRLGRRGNRRRRWHDRRRRVGGGGRRGRGAGYWFGRSRRRWCDFSWRGRGFVRWWHVGWRGGWGGGWRRGRCRCGFVRWWHVGWRGGWGGRKRCCSWRRGAPRRRGRCSVRRRYTRCRHRRLARRCRRHITRHWGEFWARCWPRGRLWPGHMRRRWERTGAGLEGRRGSDRHRRIWRYSRGCCSQLRRFRRHRHLVWHREGKNLNRDLVARRRRVGGADRHLVGACAGHASDERDLYHTACARIERTNRLGEAGWRKAAAGSAVGEYNPGCRNRTVVAIADPESH
jgi:hypothetical protein